MAILTGEENQECLKCKKEKGCMSAHVYDNSTKCIGLQLS